MIEGVLQHALVEIGLLPHEQGVVGVCIHEGSITGILRFLIMIQLFYGRAFRKESVTHFAHIGSRHLADGNLRKTLRNDTLLVKLQFDPWRVTADDVEAVAKPEDFEELEHRVEEMVTVGKHLDILEAHGVVEERATPTLYLSQNLLLRLDDGFAGRLVLRVGSVLMDKAFELLLIEDVVHVTFGKQAELTFRIDIDAVFQCLTCALVDGLIADIEHGVDVAPVFLAGRQLTGMVIVPKPQGAPVVHDHLQAEVGVVVAVAGIVESFLLGIVLCLVILHGGLSEDTPQVGLVVSQRL